MNDRELLEFAAKAAGLDYRTTEGMDRLIVRGDDKLPRPWNPLTSDGDAFRLAARLSMDVFINQRTVRVEWSRIRVIEGCQIADCRTDRPRATRRAIVRAAAEIGRSIKGLPK